MIDLTQKIISHTGSPFVNSETREDMTVKDVITAVLTQPIPGEQLTREEKIRLYQFFTSKIENKVKVELSTEERELILDRADKMYPSPLLLGRLMTVI
jgi:hypothetical protein